MIALLGCGWPPHKTYKWEDARQLFSYGKEAYALCRVEFEEEYPPLSVTGGLYWEEDGRDGRKIQVCGGLPPGETGFSLLLGEKEQVIRRVILPEQAAAPVKKGQEMGRVEYLLEGKTIFSYPLLAAQEVERMTMKRGMARLWELFWSAG